MRRTTPSCKGAFVLWSGRLPESTLWDGMALLARWFRFQPDGIDGLSVDEFVGWLERASDQIKRERA